MSATDKATNVCYRQDNSRRNNEPSGVQMFDKNCGQLLDLDAYLKETPGFGCMPEANAMILVHA